MSILNLNAPQARGPRGKKTTKIWMGVGLLVAVLGVGSTFASTITINPAGNTEFGQGVEKTIYCGGSSGSLTVTPTSSYKNSSNDSTLGNFYLASIRVTDIPSDCDGVNFVFSMYDSTDGSTTPISLATSGGSTLSVPAVYWRTKSVSANKYVATPSSTSDCQKGASEGGGHSAKSYGGILSLSRTAYVSPCLVAYLTSQSASAFTINVQSSANLVNVISAARIVVETQNDTFGASALSGSTYGLVKD